ncbi:putative Erythronolide synthase, modules 1 and 2 [Streptomyces aurantiacus JA 4570]|uniref:Putative Erythronolide synthase, modules 1 and 2 n=1 Tax=Streptomyces aurantiacus JA 4570 TaxID=1286094 RepID=S3ZF57_9ACTN|nr:putative Erythronolide synthase, modules 1 and 2 [Streptomyces aurantiacus JA 4570]
MLEPRPRHRQRPCDVAQFEFSVRQQMLTQPGGLLAQCLGCLRRQGQRRDAGRRLGGVGRRVGPGRLVRRGLLHDHVGVRAAHTERRDARASGRAAAAFRPVPGPGEQFDRARRPVHFGGRGVHVQRLGQHAVPHRHDHLHDARDTGRGLRVSDVGLDGAEPQGLVGRPLLAVGGEERLRLDRVAERRTGAVRLDRVHLACREARVGQRGPDDAALRRTVGGGQAVARAVLVDRGTSYDGEDPVAVAAGVRKTLDQQHAHALAPARPVRGLRERLAPARREPALTAELHEGGGRRHHRDTAGERHGALAPAQRLTRQVQGDEGRRARRVDGHGHRRAFEAERVGDAAGGDARGVADAEVALDLVGDVVDSGGVVLAVGAREHADLAAAQRGRVDARALERLPGGLQEEPLLRVHGEGLARVDAEELGVELPGVVEESAFADVRGSGLPGVGVEEAVGVPAAVGGEVGDRVDAVGHQAPQLFGAAYAAGEAAAHADDGEGFVLGGGRGGGGGQRGRAVVAEQFGVQMGGQGGRRGVVEDQRGGQPEAGGRADEVAQFDRRERVEAQLAEGAGDMDVVGARVAEDVGRLGAHQVEERGFAVRRGQGGEAVGEGVRRGGGARRRAGGGRRVREGRVRLRDVREEAARPGGGEARRVLVPVDVDDDRQWLVVAEGLVQGGDREVRVHGRHHAVPQPLGRRALGGHAGAVPGAPGDGRRHVPGGPPGLGQRVQGRVGGGVTALARPARDAGEGREEHKRRQVRQVRVAGQLVQVPGRLHLRAEHGGQPVLGEAVEHAVVQDSGRVEDAGQRGVAGDLGEQPGERCPVGDVAGSDRHAGAQLLQFRAEFGRAGGVGAASAGQDEVPGALACQPAGDVCAEGARAAGDQDRAATRGPLRGLLAAEGRAHQPAHEHAGRAHRGLVLALRGREDPGEARGGGGVGGFGEVDEAAPGLRVLQRGDPAEAPDARLRRVGGRLGGCRRHRAAGRGPDGGGAVRVAERLEQNCLAQGGRCDLGLFGERQERQGAVPRRRLVPAQQFGERRAVGGGGRRDAYDGDAGAGGREGAFGGGAPREVPGLVGDEQGPGAREGGGAAGLRGRQGVPGDAVAPAVQGGGGALLAPPGRQGGQDRGERGVVGHVQGAGEFREVLVLHGLPEACLGVVGGRRAGGVTGGGRGGRVQPVPLVLERVRGQGDAAARPRGGVPGGPVDGGAAYVQPGQGGEEGVGLGPVAAQGGDESGLGVGAGEGVVRHRGEDGVGAQFEEGGDAEVGEGGQAVVEADGLTHVPHPVLGVLQLGGGGEASG